DGVPLTDQELSQRIRAVARRKPWLEVLPENQRIVFPGYSNLREISKTRTQVFENNIGSGFMSYFRPSNIRMVFLESKGYQEKTHQNLDAVLARGDTFVAFLTTYPKMSINHAVLIYGRKKSRPGDELEPYLVYDPNHAEAPRELTWSPRESAFAYQKDIDFIGGFVRVYQATTSRCSENDRRVLDMIPGNSRTAAGFWQLGAFAALVLLQSRAAASDFRFDRDTVGFANATVFEYREGHPYLRRQREKGEPKRYTRRCFVLCRTTMQFHKFAPFDPHAPPLDDNALAARIRNVTRRAAWEKPLPTNQRVVFPGYANLRAMSDARREVVRRNIGLGWPTYFRLGNFRMLFEHDSNYHKETHANLQIGR